MTKTDTTPFHPILVAIDIAKHRNEVLIAEPGRKRRRRITIRNIKEDHERLVETLTAYNAPVVVGFEPTGDYHRPIAWRLHQAGFSLQLISSLSLARTREAMHNSWDSRRDRGRSPRKPERRSQGRSSHAAHDADGTDPDLARSSGSWLQ